jgi:hypothetical protein
MILYHYAQAVKEAAKDPVFRQYLVNSLTVNNQAKAPSLLTLAQGNASFSAFINTKLRQSMTDKNIYPKGVEAGVENLIALGTWDANTYLRGKMSHMGYTYDPVIYYMKKPEPTTNSIDATVLIAEDVNDCDDVAGWRGDIELLMSEAQATASNEFIIFVGPGKPVKSSNAEIVDDGEETKFETSSILSNPYINLFAAEDRHGAHIDVSSVRINGCDYRYENSGRSEIAGWVVGFNTSPVVAEVFRNHAAFFDKFKKCTICDAKLVTYTPPLLISDVPTGWATSSAFIGFYEHDWYVLAANTKTVSCSCSGTSTIPDVSLQMKYSNEWYINTEFCGTGTSLLPASGSTATGTNTKATFLLTRAM